MRHATRGVCGRSVIAATEPPFFLHKKNKRTTRLSFAHTHKHTHRHFLPIAAQMPLSFPQLRAAWHPPVADASQPLTFQAFDWYPHDVRQEPPKPLAKMSYEERQEYYEDPGPRVKFTMDVSGVGANGETYALRVESFQPYYYVRLPLGTTSAQAGALVEYLRSNDYFLPKSMKPELHTAACVVEPYYAYHGYQFDTKHPFLKLVFHSDRARKRMLRQMERGCHLGDTVLPQVTDRVAYYYFEMYEPNVESLVRFFHDGDINPCGWLHLEAGMYDVVAEGDGVSSAYVSLECEASCVQCNASQQMGKVMICSFDIEADSSHGDFPLAVKDYTKPANELIRVYLKWADKQVAVSTTKLEMCLKHLFRKLSTREQDRLGDYARTELSHVFVQEEGTGGTEPDYRAVAIEVAALFYRAILSDLHAGDVVNVHTPGKTASEKDQVVDSRPRTPGRANVASESQYDKEYLLKKKKGWYRLRDQDGTDDRTSVRISRENGHRSYALMTPTEWKRRKPRLLKSLVQLMTKRLPTLRGDQVIQIGSVFWRFGEPEPCLRHLLALDTCDPIEGAVVEWFQTERELLVRWAELMRELAPHIVTGYNIFGFDYKFMWERADTLGAASAFGDLSPLTSYSTSLPHRRHKSSTTAKLMPSRKPGGVSQCRCDGMHCKLLEKELTSAGLGENRLYYMDVPGMVQIDMCKDIMKDHNLSSYKLDDVASTFIHGNITDVERDADGATTVLWSNNAYGIRSGDFLYLYETTVIGAEPVDDERKFQLRSLTTVDGKHRFELTEAVTLPTEGKYEWGLGKDDVSPQDIFRMQHEGPAERAVIGKYCIQDCQLVLTLMMKLQTVSNNVGMASVCTVPLQYIFTRGQGVKTFSLLARECAKRGYRIPYRRADGIVPTNLPRDEQDTIHVKGFPPDRGEPPDEKETFQGAFVLDPKPGIYLDEAIAVLDYSSLYPSSIISHNLCPTSIVLDPAYQGEDGAKKLTAMGLKFRDVTYDNYVSFRKGATYDRQPNKAKPTTTCRYIQPDRQADGSIVQADRGVLPQTLQILLSARKATRKKIKTEKDPFVQAVLDGLQLAYKVTANSIYGSLGASTNPIFFKDIAASTTATGRDMLLFAQDFVTSRFPGSEIIYGDTDSIFIHFHPKGADGAPLKGKEALIETIQLGVEAGKQATFELQDVQGLAPQDLEYEKTFCDFTLVSKKRYLAMKYELDPNKGKLSYMGIVLKRRDNARIVKRVYADVLDAILTDKSVPASIVRLHANIERLLAGQVPLRDLIISKSLRSHYDNPEQIVHKVLADRMADRDPGNKPQANDRIPYVYVAVDEKLVTLQGDRVEHPDYIREHKLQVDALFYITNQIAKPISQIYGLVVEQLPGYKYKSDPEHFHKLRRKYREEGRTKEWIDKKVTDLRVNMAQELLFGRYVRAEKNRREGSQSITKWFGKKA